MVKVLVTGATGYIGSHVVKQLLEKGYEVVGVTSRPEGIQKIKDLGATPLVADVREPQKIADAAKETDGVIHLGFIHDFSNYAESVKIDIKFIETIIEAYSGTNKPFLTSSGTASDIESIEKPLDDSEPIKSTNGRGAAEAATLKGADRGVRTAVLRLAPFVYGENGSYFIKDVLHVAKERGEANFIEGSTNAIGFAHVEDEARLYVLAFEKGKAGAIYHGTNRWATFTEIAQAAAKNLNVPLKAIQKEDAPKIWPQLWWFYVRDARATASRAESELGWKDTHPGGLIDDVVNGSYKQK
eukprot:TRINITY_DN8655_c0_g1_i1.p1 TRINITY_DN8655_c0_g1~~TRINITY_DN8655_c0_g1_i1.p1  ORF type:complete len:299 (+),score=85.70 TRINITY_DN8655_c0_g1_i1:193-1089(+)